MSHRSHQVRRRSALRTSRGFRITSLPACACGCIRGYGRPGGSMWPTPHDLVFSLVCVSRSLRGFAVSDLASGEGVTLQLEIRGVTGIRIRRPPSSTILQRSSRGLQYQDLCEGDCRTTMISRIVAMLPTAILKQLLLGCRRGKYNSSRRRRGGGGGGCV